MRHPARDLAIVAFGLLVTVASAAAQDASWSVYRDDQEGITLRYPPRFVSGAYRSDLPPDLARTLRASGGRLPFEGALVLVESVRLGSRDRAALPAGEITAITVETQTGPAVGARLDLGRQIYGAAITEVTIGVHRVQKFPGFPGPYGSLAFYYLVPLRDGSALELTGHRVFLEAPRGDTGYDRVIEQIIGTLVIDPRRP
ncbi:MAG TPA: hypothetical protein VNQ54_03470 [Methylomirabilota bacterium]|jgi:hypothetical protein|nr:hypothetical protein [Candidatus Dormibacteraeota bacterium]HWO03822.1 hypothetical protein [Methylomirabilota bacterium]